MSYLFNVFADGDGYKADLPGSLLIEAQRTGKAFIPLADGGEVNLAGVDWYSGRAGQDYKDIKEIEFETDAVYTVRYMVRNGPVKLRAPYMFAVRTVAAGQPARAS